MGSEEPTQRGVWSRIGKRIAVRPRAVWIVTALLLLAGAAGMTQLHAHQMSSADAFVNKPDSVIGAELQAQYFPPSSGQSLDIIGNADKVDA